MVNAEHIFLLAVLVFAYGTISASLSRSIVTAPIAFVLFGMAFAPRVAEWLGFEGAFDALGHADGLIHLLGEITLVVVLFTDAAQIQIRKLLGGGAAIPLRLLVVGMPLTIILGAALAWPFFGEIGLWQIVLLATMLAPTDAALGQAVVTDDRVPLRIRQGLSVESGLNDGFAVPLVLVFAALASVGHEADGEMMTHAVGVGFAAKQVLLGPLAGAVSGVAGAWIMGVAIRRKWMGHAYQQLAGIALALIAYAFAHVVGGNGFIAAFVAGLVVGNSKGAVCLCLYDFAEAESQLLMLATFFLVGIVLAWEPILDAGWQAWVYAGLSLTVVRMVPVAIAMVGLRLRPGTALFLGWFGPRGLASILFALLVIDGLPVPNGDLIVQVVLLTVLMSVMAHGITAAPWSGWYARYIAADRSRAAFEFGTCPEELIRKRALTDDDPEGA